MKTKSAASSIAAQAIVISAFLAGIPSVNAATLFDNGYGLRAAGYFADSEFNSVVADDFVLNDAVTITSVSWSGVYYSSVYHYSNVPANPDGFRIYFFNDAGGTPGTSVGSQTVSVTRNDSGMNDVDFGLDLYRYHADLLVPVELAAGTYWLGLMNDTASTQAAWLWAGGEQTHGAAARRSANGGVSFYDIDPTPQRNFVLGGTVVPEPSAVFLIGVGSFGAIAWRRRAG